MPSSPCQWQDSADGLASLLRESESTIGYVWRNGLWWHASFRGTALETLYDNKGAAQVAVAVKRARGRAKMPSRMLYREAVK